MEQLAVGCMTPKTCHVVRSTSEVLQKYVLRKLQLAMRAVVFITMYYEVCHEKVAAKFF